MRKIGLAVFLLSLASVSSPALTDEPGSKLAITAINLMRRSLEVEPPATIPKHLRRRVSQDEIEIYESEYRFELGILFFEYPLTRTIDRGLYRDLKRFWKTSPSKKLLAFPHLADRYFNEPQPLKDLILELMLEIASDGIGVKGGAAALEPSVLAFLRRSSDAEDLEAGVMLLAELHELSEDADNYLMRYLNSGRGSCEIRAEIVQTLDRRRAVESPDVSSFLLDTAMNDPCELCRVWAVSYGQLMGSDSSTVLARYLSILDNALADERWPVAHRVMRVVGTWGKRTEAVQHIIPALYSKNTKCRAEAVNALEKIAEIPSDEVPDGYEAAWAGVGYDDEVSMMALDKAVSLWLSWWQGIGSELLELRGPEEYKTAARQIYARVGDSE